MKDNSLNRRNFLKGTLVSGGLAASSSLLSPSAFANKKSGDADHFEDLSNANWEAIRNQFSLSPDWVHMAGFLLASNPKPVAAAIEKHRRELDIDPTGYLQSAEHHAEQANLVAAGKYLNTKPEQIAITESTTASIALLYAGLSIRPDQEVLTTEHDHYATFNSLAFSTERSGASIKRISLYEEPSKLTVEQVTDRIKKAITPKTRIIAITWVHSGTGVKLPIAEISKVVKQANRGRSEEDRALLCVDGVHGFGIDNIDINDMGCDFFMAGIHKWMFGPRGTAILWGAEDAWQYLSPTIPTFHQKAFMKWMGYLKDDGLPQSVHLTPGGTHAFEHHWAINEAFNFHMNIGKDRVSERIHELNRQAKQGLTAIPGVHVYTPQSDDLSAGIIAFEIEGVQAYDAIAALKKQGIIATQAPYAVSHARLAPGLINTVGDVEYCLKAVRELA